MLSVGPDNHVSKLLYMFSSLCYVLACVSLLYHCISESRRHKRIGVRNENTLYYGLGWSRHHHVTDLMVCYRNPRIKDDRGRPLSLTPGDAFCFPATMEYSLCHVSSKAENKNMIQPWTAAGETSPLGKCVFRVCNKWRVCSPGGNHRHVFVSIHHVSHRHCRVKMWYDGELRPVRCWQMLELTTHVCLITHLHLAM